MATDSERSKFDALLYPGTDVLVNRFDVRDPVRLAEIERRLTSFAAASIKKNPIAGNFALAHMQEIHKKMFGGVYPWAGQVRDYPLLKERPDGLVTEFARPDEIAKLDEALKVILASTKNFTAVRPDDFPKEMARVFQIANDMHPFREGNGRTHRAYLDSLAKQAGHTLDFTRLDKEAWNYAASMSGRVNIGGGTRIEGRTDELVKVFNHISQAAEQQNAYKRGREGMQAAERPAIMKLADLNPRLAEKKIHYRAR